MKVYKEAFEKHMLKTYGGRWQEIGYPPNEILGVWQACAELKDKIIEQQAAEIAALRGFVQSLCEIETYDETFNKASVESAKKWSLLDENGNPTALLTGNETE